MASWDTSTWVSVLALTVSGLSLFAAVWAAWVSHRTLKHAQDVHAADRRIAFERERAQLLEVINQSRSILDKTRIHIGALKANFDAAPQPAQALMHRYTSLFTEYLPRIEAGIRQANALWDEVAEWDQQNGIEALVWHQAKFRALLRGDQVAHDQAVVLVETFEKKFAMALDYIKGATR